MLKRIEIATSHAGKQTSRYFGGYTAKVQPVGKNAVAMIDKSFEYLVRSTDACAEEKRCNRFRALS